VPLKNAILLRVFHTRLGVFHTHGHRNNLAREALGSLPAKLTPTGSDVVPQLILQIINNSTHRHSSTGTANAPMSILAETPLDRARAKRDRIERELKRCPDFQLYLIAKSWHDRARMERLLVQIPSFRLWCMLTDVIERPRSRAAASRVADRSGARYLPSRLAAAE
jgi:hypothetical protein